MPTIVSLQKSCYQYRVEDVGVITSIEHWDLGPGESQVIALCISGSRSAVLDDRAARRCAAAHNVPVIGTLGIVLRFDGETADRKRPLEPATAIRRDLTTSYKTLPNSMRPGEARAAVRCGVGARSDPSSPSVISTCSPPTVAPQSAAGTPVDPRCRRGKGEGLTRGPRTGFR
jgi:hypothetical protein